MANYFKTPISFTKPLAPDMSRYTEYLKDIFQTGIFTNNGPFVQQLEFQLRKYLNVPYCSVYNNGTTALMIALRSLKKNNYNNYIVTSSYTFPATVTALLWNDLRPIWCDIDYDTMNISPKNIEKLLAPHIVGIMPVHIFGNPCDVEGFKNIAENNNKNLIYDAAHAFGVAIDNVGIGNFGDFTMFSFHPTKLFHTGEGGALACGNRYLDENIKKLRNFGIENNTTGSVLPGINGKMNELQAAIGLEILKQIDEEREKRKKVFKTYRFLLSDLEWIKFLDISKNIKQNYLYFPMRFIGKSRDRIHDYLLKNNVYTCKYFYPLCHQFKYLREFHQKMPIAEKISEEILCFPCYGELSQEDIYQICKLIIKADKK